MVFPSGENSKYIPESRLVTVCIFNSKLLLTNLVNIYSRNRHIYQINLLPIWVNVVNVSLVWLELYEYVNVIYIGTIFQFLII